MKLLNQPLISKLMARENLQVLVAATPPNVFYLTGYYSLTHWMMAGAEVYAVKSSDPDLPPSLVLPISDADNLAEQNPQVGPLFVHGTFHVEAGQNRDQNRPEDPWLNDATELLRKLIVMPLLASARAALVEAVAALGTSSLRIGLDEKRISPDLRQELADKFTQHHFIPASDLITKARMIKTPEERDRLRQSALITEAGMMAVIDQLYEGMIELEAQMVFETTLISRGARPGFTVIGFGPHSAYPNATPSHLKLRLGDMVRFDAGCIYKNYWSDLSRGAVFGQPSKKIKQYYQALIQGQDAAISLIKPGIKAGVVFEAAVQAVRKAGIPNYQRQHVGHGIGLEVYDPPILSPNSEAVIEEGMVLCVETPYYELGFSGFQIEDTVVVTPNGCEILNQTERKLYVKE